VEVIVRLSVVLLLMSLAGVLAGGWLISPVVFGASVIFDSLCVGVYALLRDDGRPVVERVHGVPTVTDILERNRAS
jgi:hypothetical protein